MIKGLLYRVKMKKKKTRKGNDQIYLSEGKTPYVKKDPGTWK
jgi:hypothetical protein